jgi:hypothetical protein
MTLRESLTLGDGRANLTMFYDKPFRDIMCRFILRSGVFEVRSCLSSFASHGVEDEDLSSVLFIDSSL